MTDKKGKINNAVSAFFGAVGALVALLLAFLAGYIYIDFSFLPAASCGGSENYVYCFFSENWDSETYLSVVSGFYSTIITILIFLLGAVAALAFIVIRGSALQQAEEAIEKEVDRFFETSKAEEKIHEGLEKVGRIELGKIEVRLEVIEIALDEADILKDGKLELVDEKKTEQTD